MKKLWGGILIASIAVVGIICGAVLSIPGNIPPVSAYVEGFQYTGPLGPSDTGRYRMGWKELNSSQQIEQMFNLGVRDFRRLPDPGGVIQHHHSKVRDSSKGGKPVDNPNSIVASGDIELPVFSNSEMNRIRYGQNNKNDYGFIVLEEGEAVALEITNLIAFGATNSWMNYNHGEFYQGISEPQGVTEYSGWGGEHGVYLEVPNEELMDTAKTVPGKLYRNNGFSLAGTFKKEGYYDFSLECVIRGDKAAQTITLKFAFYIVHAEYYVDNATKINRPALQQDGNIYKWGEGNQFYYSFNGTFPYIAFDSRRFDVEVEANDALGLTDQKFAYTPCGQKLFLNISETNNCCVRSFCRRYDFKTLGDYKINAQIVYNDQKRTVSGVSAPWIKARNYAPYQYRLSIFGVQAYYENYEGKDPDKQLLFGGKGDGADISNHDAIKAIPIWDADPGRKRIWTELSTPEGRGDPNNSAFNISPLDNTANIRNLTYHPIDNPTGLKPVVTNAPPVSLKANVLTNIRTGPNGRVLPAGDTSGTIASRAYFNNGTGWKQSGCVTECAPECAIPAHLFERDGLYERAGEYFVVVYFKYSVADISHADNKDKTSVEEILFRQVFYFKIVNHIDARIEADGKEYYFNDFARRNININTGFIVYMYTGVPQDAIGPYEAAPQFELWLHNYDGTVKQRNQMTTSYPYQNPRVINGSDIDPITGRLKFFEFNGNIAGGNIENGVYVFRVKYGNKRVSWMDFSVTVDTELLKEAKITGTGNELENYRYVDPTTKSDKFAIFGSQGEGPANGVGIEWANKSSGLGFKGFAQVGFYEFVYNTFKPGGPGLVDDGGRGYFSSPYRLSKELKYFDNVVIEDKGENGWCLASAFTQAGLYFVTIEDEVGNMTYFSFIIDDTPVSFAQDMLPKAWTDTSPRLDAPNIIDLSEFPGRHEVIVAYPKKKIIDFEETGSEGLQSLFNLGKDPSGQLNSIYTVLQTRGLFFEGSVYVEIETHEISSDNFNFIDITSRGITTYETVTINAEGWDNNVVTVQVGDNRVWATAEGFYFFRAIDALGNETTYSLWINPDKCQAMILEDIAAGTDGKSSTASIVRPNGTASLEYVYFSFEPAKDPTNDEKYGTHYMSHLYPAIYTDTGPKYIVDLVTLSFYPFTFQGSTDPYRPDYNPNYPFSATQSGDEKIIFDSRNNAYASSNATYLTELKNGAVPTSISIPINQVLPQTAEGLYIITRYYDYRFHPLDDIRGDSPVGLDQVKNYFFIVDRNDVIPFDGNPFQSDIKLIFGDCDGHGNDPNCNILDLDGNYKDCSSRKKADWRDLERRIQTNSPVTATLPKNRTKYGGPLDFKSDWKNGEGIGLFYRWGWAGGSTVTPSNNINGQMDLKNSWEEGSDQLNGRTGSNQSVRIPGLGLNVKLQKDRQNTANPFLGIGGSIVSHQITDNGKYQMTIADGSGGMNWMPYGTSGARVVDANRTVLNFEIMNEHLQGEWVVNDTVLPSWRTSARVKPGDKLEFKITNDLTDFFAEVLSNDMNPRFIVDGDPVDKTDPRYVEAERYVSPTRIITTYDLTKFIEVGNERIEIQIISEGHKGLPYERRLTVDNNAPNYNGHVKVGNIRGQDLMYYQELDTFGKYVYAITDPNFAFERKLIDPGYQQWYGSYKGTALEGKDVHDSFEITYQRVDVDLVPNFGGATTLQLGDYDRPFIDVVNMRGVQDCQSCPPGTRHYACQTRIYRIVERDEAGNESIYYIQLRTADFVNIIEATGFPDTGTGNLIGNRADGQLFGNNFRINDAREYWEVNPFFKWEYRIGISQDVTIFTRLKGHSTDTTQRSNFEAWVQTMLNAGRDNVIELTINDSFSISRLLIAQCTSTTPLANVIVDRFGTDGDQLSVDITKASRDNLLSKFPNVSVGFTLEIFEIKGSDSESYEKGTPDKFTLVGELYERDSVGLDVERKITRNPGVTAFVIRVTDSFGRVVIKEHHEDPFINAKDAPYTVYSGNTRLSNGVRYTGHQDGVRLEWNPNVYVLDLFVNGEIDRERSSGNIDPSNPDRRFLIIRPEQLREGGDNRQFQAVFKYKVSEVVVHVEEWRFYNVLPELTFKNINGDPLDQVESGTDIIGGVVQISFDSQLDGMIEVSLDRRGFLFASTVSYEIDATAYGGTIERVPIGTYATRFTLDKVGKYTITVTNAVSATRRYVIEISDVENLSYKIMFKNRQLEESPEGYIYNDVRISAFDANGKLLINPATEKPIDVLIPGTAGTNIPQTQTRKIPVYWIDSSDADDITISHVKALNPNMKSNIGIGASAIIGVGNTQIIPSMNYGRQLVHVGGGSNMGNNPEVYGATSRWQIYYLYSEVTGTRLYFVLACTKVTPTVRLLVNEVQGRTSSYNNDLFANGEKVAVRLDRRHMSNGENQSGDAGTTVPSTNVYYIDYYQNGQYCGRLLYDDVLTMEKQDYGTFEFHIMDWAENIKTFGAGTATGTADSRPMPYFTIYNFSQVPILINGDAIIDEMVYNDYLDISIQDAKLRTESSIYFYLAYMYIERDGIPYLKEPFETSSKLNTSPTWSFTESGRYRIKCVYNAGTTVPGPGGGPSGSHLVTSEHIVQLVGTQSMPSFYFSGASNIDIVSVKRFGDDVTSEYGVAPIKKLLINSEGLYQITFEIAATNVRDRFTVMREVSISSINAMNTKLVAITNKKSEGFGERHKGTVELTFNPQAILMTCRGTATVSFYKDGKLIRDEKTMTDAQEKGEEEFKGISINNSMQQKDDNGNLVEIDISDDMIRAFTEQGKYKVIVTASGGTVVFANSFEIRKKANPMVMIVLIGVAVAAVIGLGIFVKLRKGMKVR